MEVSAEIEKPLKVAIVGKAPSSLAFAPYKDESWEIWWLGTGAHLIPRWTRCFELHELGEGRKRWPAEYWQWLTTDHGRPLYIQQGQAEIPHARVYPQQPIVAEFGRYFTSSIAWMIALAIQEGAAEIGLWGVDMATDTEYAYQRANCEYLLGVAVGRGISVSVAAESPLCKCVGMYAFDGKSDDYHRHLAARKKELSEAQQEIDKVFSNAQNAKWKLQGMLDENTRMSQYA